MKIIRITAVTVIACILSCIFSNIYAQSKILSGSVKDTEGRPVVGAVVTDGFTHCVTDGNGNYRFESPCPERVRFVSVRIPADYRPVLRGSIPVFYTAVDTYKGQERKADITLQKRDRTDDNFTLLMMADPQAYVYSKKVKKENVAYASTEAWVELFADMKEKIASTSGECYGICMGDVAASLKIGSVYPEYCTKLATLEIPFYQVIGNHDHYYEIADNDDQSAAAYEEAFGPRNYSFDMGQYHFVVLDNCIFIKNLRRYPFKYGLEDEFLEWLKSDLALVPKDKPVMICAHADFFNENGLVELEYDGMKSDYNYEKFLEAIQGFDKLTVWAGHTHTTSFIGKVNTPANPSGVEAYVVGRPTGDMPINEYVSGDGTPRGYVVVDVRGKEMSWKYRTIELKSTSFRGDEKPKFKWDKAYTAGETQQMRTYPRGAYGDDFVYANIYLWDQHWSTPVLKIGKKEYPMTRDYIYDMGWKEIHDFYWMKSSKVPNIRGSRNTHGFMVRVPERASGTGTVEVTDRFGRTWTSDVSVDPLKYDDGLKRIMIDLRKAPKNCPVEKTQDIRFKCGKYDFKLSSGYYKESNDIEDRHICMTGSGSTLVLPAMEGYRLVSITVRPAGNRFIEQHARITDINGKEVQGGGDIRFFGNVTDTWVLDRTDAGASYQIISDSNTFRIGEIRLAYKKM